MSEEHKSLKQIIDFRKEKLFKLKESGIDPYPQKFAPNHFSQDIIYNFITQFNIYTFYISFQLLHCSCSNYHTCYEWLYLAKFKGHLSHI